MPRDYAQKTFLPNKHNEDDRSNLLAIERSFHDIRPVCIGATGDPGNIPAGTPGVRVIVTWTANTNVLYDHTNMIGPTPTQNLRIPWDGFYSFHQIWDVGDTITGNLTIEVTAQVAQTSDTGFGAIAWNNLVNSAGILWHTSYFVNNGVTVVPAFPVDLRGVELHANDMIRFLVRLHSAQALGDTFVTFTDFRFLYPIPAELP